MLGSLIRKPMGRALCACFYTCVCFFGTLTACATPITVYGKLYRVPLKSQARGRVGVARPVVFIPNDNDFRRFFKIQGVHRVFGARFDAALPEIRSNIGKQSGTGPAVADQKVGGGPLVTEITFYGEDLEAFARPTLNEGAFKEVRARLGVRYLIVPVVHFHKRTGRYPLNKRLSEMADYRLLRVYCPNQTWFEAHYFFMLLNEHGEVLMSSSDFTSTYKLDRRRLGQRTWKTTGRRFVNAQVTDVFRPYGGYNRDMFQGIRRGMRCAARPSRRFDPAHGFRKLSFALLRDLFR